MTKLGSDLLNEYYGGNSVKGAGDVVDLRDLGMMPNLRSLCLAAENISAIDPISQLTQLEYLELKHNHIAYIDPLSSLQKLQHIGLSMNPVEDISPLAAMPSLKQIDLTSSAAKFDPAPLRSLDHLDSLSLAGCSDGYKYISGKSIGYLRLSYSQLDSLDWIKDVKDLTQLDVSYTQLTSLDGLEDHRELISVNIAGNDITDFSPLFSLPYLNTLTLSEKMAVNASDFDNEYDVNIVYQ